MLITFVLLTLEGIVAGSRDNILEMKKQNVDTNAGSYSNAILI